MELGITTIFLTLSFIWFLMFARSSSLVGDSFRYGIVFWRRHLHLLLGLVIAVLILGNSQGPLAGFCRSIGVCINVKFSPFETFLLIVGVAGCFHKSLIGIFSGCSLFLWVLMNQSLLNSGSTQLTHSFILMIIFLGMTPLIRWIKKRNKSEPLLLFLGFGVLITWLYALLDISTVQKFFETTLGLRLMSPLLLIFTLGVILGWVAFTLKEFRRAIMVFLLIPSIWLFSYYFSSQPLILVGFFSLYGLTFVHLLPKSVR